jgi:hypothetical protein
MRGWHCTEPGPNRAKVGPAGPTSLVGQPGVGAISISALPTYQERSVHGVSDAQSRSRPSWVADRPCVQPAGQGLVSYRLKSMVELTHSTYKYPHTPFGEREIKKWGLDSYSAPKFIFCRVERERGEVLRAGGLPDLSGVLPVAQAWKLC